MPKYAFHTVTLDAFPCLSVIPYRKETAFPFAGFLYVIFPLTTATFPHRFPS